MLKVKVILEGQMRYKLSLSQLLLVHFWTDFKIIWHRNWNGDGLVVTCQQASDPGVTGSIPSSTGMKIDLNC